MSEADMMSNPPPPPLPPPSQRQFASDYRVKDKTFSRAELLVNIGIIWAIALAAISTFMASTLFLILGGGGAITNIIVIVLTYKLDQWYKKMGLLPSLMHKWGAVIIILSILNINIFMLAGGVYFVTWKGYPQEAAVAYAYPPPPPPPPP